MVHGVISVAATDKTNATVTFNFEVSDGIGDTVSAGAELSVENSEPTITNSTLYLDSAAIGDTINSCREYVININRGK